MQGIEGFLGKFLNPLPGDVPFKRIWRATEMGQLSKDRGMASERTPELGTALVRGMFDEFEGFLFDGGGAMVEALLDDVYCVGDVFAGAADFPDDFV